MIEYRYNFPLDPLEIIKVFNASGIKRPINDLPRIVRMFTNADLVISAIKDEKLVGICRALTDYSYCCYLSDLAVDMNYQKQGIGKHMINMLHNILGEEITIILLASKNAMDYYPTIGMERAENAFVIKRKR